MFTYFFTVLNEYLNENMQRGSRYFKESLRTDFQTDSRNSFSSNLLVFFKLKFLKLHIKIIEFPVAVPLPQILSVSQ